MASATSCFNSTLYKKTMARFWPLWAGYALIWAFALPLNLCSQYMDWSRWGGESPAIRAANWALSTPIEVLQPGVWLSALFGVLSAMAVFGYLYASRSACWFHALPMRREALFTTQYLAGLSFALLPQAAIALMTLAAELLVVPSYAWGLAFQVLGTWFLVQSAVALFFFSFAAFCAMFTGHTLALPVFYGILNILVMSVFDLVCMLMASFLYGFDYNPSIVPLVKFCTPVFALNEACAPDWSDVSLAGLAAESCPQLASLRAPLTVAGFAAAGVVFALLALLVYRKRHAETAGDVVSVSLVKPLFRCGVSFCAGLFFGTFTAAFFGWDEAIPLTLCVVVWAVIGCFAAEMLLQKSFRVWKRWPWAAGMAGAMVLLCAVLFLDLFGIAKRVPRAEEVASLTVSGQIGYPQRSVNLTLDDPEDIRKFVDLHRAVVNERDRALDGRPISDGNWDETIHLTLEYALKNGSVLCRRYYNVPIYRAELNKEGSVTWAANQVLQTPGLIQNTLALMENAGPVYAWLGPVYDTLQDTYRDLSLEGPYQALWQAVRQDLEEGALDRRWLFSDSDGEGWEDVYSTTLEFELERTRDTTSRGDRPATMPQNLSIPLTPDARHTLAALEEMGALEDGVALVGFDEDGAEVPIK